MDTLPPPSALPMVMDVIVDIDSDRGKPGISPNQIEASTMGRIRSGLLRPPGGGGERMAQSHTF